MILRHVALTCSSEEKADLFYAHLLGLTKSEPKTLPAELAEAIFSINAELRIINYLDADNCFEIFIAHRSGKNTRQIEHVCLEVDDLERFLEKCRRINTEIMEIRKADKILTFVRDFDGNLFEIKRKALFEDRPASRD